MNFPFVDALQRDDAGFTSGRSAFSRVWHWPPRLGPSGPSVPPSVASAYDIVVEPGQPIAPLLAGAPPHARVLLAPGIHYATRDGLGGRPLVLGRPVHIDGGSSRSAILRSPVEITAEASGSR